MTRPAVVAGQDLAHDRVQLLVQAADVLEAFFHLLNRFGGMLHVGIPPQHVRLQVGAGKVEEQDAVVVVRHGVVQQTEPLVQHALGLDDELLVVEHAVGPRLVVFLESGGGEQSQVFGNLRGKAGRLGNPHGRIRGIDIDGTGVQAERRRHLLQIKTADAADVLVRQRGRRRKVEIQLDPRAPTVLRVSSTLRSGNSTTAASACRSRCTNNSMLAACTVFNCGFSGPTRLALAVSCSNTSRERLPPASSVVVAGPSSAKN